MKVNFSRRQHNRLEVFCLCFLMGGLLFLISGCSMKPGTLQRLNTIPAKRICSVAVLPFVSEVDYPLAATIAYKEFSTELNDLSDYRIIQEGDVRKLYQQIRIWPGRSPTQEEFQILARRLDAQILFIGHITQMRENPGFGGKINPVVAMRIDVLDGNTAEILWSIYLRRQGMDYQKIMHFGINSSVAGLCQQISKEIIHQLFQKGLNQCNVTPLS